MPEVCGEAVEYINPSRSENITKALEKVLSSKRKREAMKKKGLAQAKKFSWEKCSRETLAVYKKVYRELEKGKKKKEKKKKKKK